MKTVYVLGSGFSSAAGIPMSNQILKEIFANPFKSEITNLKNWLENHFFYKNPDWIKENRFGEILSRLDLIKYYRPLKNTNYQNIHFFENQLISAFVDLLSIKTPNKLPECYIKFANNLTHLDTIVTFNHDQIVEKTLYQANIKYNYCLIGQLPTNELPLLKLHGSINMLYCPKCLRVFIDQNNYHNCEGNLQPLVIAPTFFKNYNIPALRQLWYYAFHTLSKAEKIVFIGYSMKKDDILSQQLFDFANRVNPLAIKMVVNGPTADVTSYKNIYGLEVINTKLKFEEL